MGATSPGAASEGQVAYLSQNKLITINVETRQACSDPAEQDRSARSGDNHLWYSADGQQLFSFGGKQGESRIDVWDVPAHRQVRRIHIAPDEHEYLQAEAYPCTSVGLMGVRAVSGDRNLVHFFDVLSGERRFSIQIPFRGTPLKAVSSDARRLLVQTDQTSILVVDFTGELPKGKVNLAGLLPEGKLAATR
jgi:hypothetical protein